MFCLMLEPALVLEICLEPFETVEGHFSACQIGGKNSKMISSISTERDYLLLICLSLLVV